MERDQSVTDNERIQGFLAGTRPHYDEIVGWITTLVRSRLWEEHVPPEDVIADTVSRLLTVFRDGSFRSDASLKTFVRQVTLYTLIDATRRQRRFVALGSRDDPPDPDTPLSRLTSREEETLIERAIALLPEGCRTLFALVLEERLSCRSIAERMETSEGAIKTRLSRCRQKAAALMRGMR